MHLRLALSWPPECQRLAVRDIARLRAVRGEPKAAEGLVPPPQKPTTQRSREGIGAGLVAAIVGNLVASTFSGAVLPVSGPRASVTLVQGGFVAILAADPALGIREILALSAL